jgi:hypothetical protein
VFTSGSNSQSGAGAAQPAPVTTMPRTLAHFLAPRPMPGSHRIPEHTHARARRLRVQRVDHQVPYATHEPAPASCPPPAWQWARRRRRPGRCPSGPCSLSPEGTRAGHPESPSLPRADALPVCSPAARAGLLRASVGLQRPRARANWPDLPAQGAPGDGPKGRRAYDNATVTRRASRDPASCPLATSSR